MLIAAMGEPLMVEEQVLFTAVTGREKEALERVDEFWSIVGRRGGKTRSAAVLGVYVATLCDHSDNLALGERGVLPIMATSTTQATRAFGHFLSVLEHSPILRNSIQGDAPNFTLTVTCENGMWRVTLVDLDALPTDPPSDRSEGSGETFASAWHGQVPCWAFSMLGVGGPLIWHPSESCALTTRTACG